MNANEFGKGTKLPAYVVGDVAGINFSPVGKVDCMIGGPPCQDLSITRGDKRSGINPASNVKKKAGVSSGRLYMEYVRAVKSAEPRFFAFENVPGLMSANGGLAYETIVSDFASNGYKIKGFKSETLPWKKSCFHPIKKLSAHEMVKLPVMEQCVVTSM